MKMSTLFRFCFVGVMASASFACGGTVEEDETSADSLSVRYTEGRDLDEFNGIAEVTAPSGGVVGETGPEVEAFDTHTCRRDAGTQCDNFTTNCTSNGGTASNSSNGLVVTCNCDVKPDGTKNNAAAACDQAVK